ncbi:hypothetical protein M011DRAFT_73523 [Sporormia fimetaria CBS 119925]|uniref:Uncharacterized protein n=1 Tax=Sporormia fimetaria CBS 119925 TaxID=1340428 RepID=A0A6A6VB96_9PLEO|nr:hypothetical protein M011DRAFT_73523 [Sporormia fimetaria CBS 119925]
MEIAAFTHANNCASCDNRVNAPHHPASFANGNPKKTSACRHLCSCIVARIILRVTRCNVGVQQVWLAQISQPCRCEGLSLVTMHSLLHAKTQPLQPLFLPGLESLVVGDCLRCMLWLRVIGAHVDPEVICLFSKGCAQHGTYTNAQYTLA